MAIEQNLPLPRSKNAPKRAWIELVYNGMFVDDPLDFSEPGDEGNNERQDENHRDYQGAGVLTSALLASAADQATGDNDESEGDQNDHGNGDDEGDAGNGDDEGAVEEEREEEEEGLVGLENFGNTCFLNALLQFLSSSRHLLLALHRDNDESKPMAYTFYQTLVHLNVMGGPTCLCLRRFKLLYDICHRTYRDGTPNEFPTGRQGDPTDFFSNVLNLMGREKGDPQGLFKIDDSQSPFFDVLLGHNGSLTEESHSVLLAKSNGHMEDGIRSLHSQFNWKLMSLGDVVVVVVGRERTSDGRQVKASKMSFDNDWEPFEGRRYQLRATICKHGHSVDSGHYTAYVRRATECVAPSWLYCDDASCATAKAEEVFSDYQQQNVLALLYELEDATISNDALTLGIDLIQQRPVLWNTVDFSDEVLRSLNLYNIDVTHLKMLLLARHRDVSQISSQVALVNAMDEFLSLSTS